MLCRCPTHTYTCDLILQFTAMRIVVTGPHDRCTVRSALYLLCAPATNRYLVRGKKRIRILNVSHTWIHISKSTSSSVPTGTMTFISKFQKGPLMPHRGIKPTICSMTLWFVRCPRSLMLLMVQKALRRCSTYLKKG